MPREREREQRGPATRAPNRDRAEYPTRERPDAARASTPYRGAQRDGGEWVSFRVTWGGDHGADARKLLAMACRWGEIRGSDVGAIEIEGDYSRLSVKASVAATFAEATSKPDSRNPRVTIQPDSQGFAPRTTPPPRAAFKARETPKAHAAEAETESVPRQPERAAYKKHADRPREAAHAPRAPREAAHAPRPGAGFPREASRPRVVTGYPRDAKKRPHSATRPGARPADAPPPRDGGEPPRRRRVVTR